jgi:hypothetical protein
VRPRVLAYVGASLLVFGYVAASCSVAPEPGAPFGQPSSSTSSSGSLIASVIASSGTGAPGACAAVEPDEEGLWLPPNDACYQPVAWANAGCAIDVAVNASLGAPPRKWVACSAFFGRNLPGCDIAIKSWSPSADNTYELGSVMKWGAGYRVGVQFNIMGPDGKQSHELSVVYDENDKPLVAWRNRDHFNKDNVCGLWNPLLTEGGVLIGAQNASKSQARYVVSGWNELSGAGKPLPYHSLMQYWHAGGNLMVSWLLNASIEAADHAKGFDLIQSADFGYPHVVAGRVLALTFPDFNHGEVAVWRPDVGQLETVVATSYPDRVMDVGGDGKSMAWIVQPDLDVPGWLWTSPWSDTKAGIVAQKRRPTPPLGLVNSTAGAGYYATYSNQDYPSDGPGDGKIHIYRMSDAREWTAELGAKYIFRDLLLIDETYVFYETASGLVRQRLDALGPGTPAP